MEKRNDEFEDIEEHDEVQDDIEMGLDKEGTYYHRWIFSYKISFFPPKRKFFEKVSPFFVKKLQNFG